MQEQWIILTGYADIQKANSDAGFLKSEDIPCRTVLDHPHSVLGFDDSGEWIFIEVLAEDYEDAADLLELEPEVLEKMDQLHEHPYRDAKRKTALYFWGGIVSAIVIFRLLADFVN